MLVKSTHDLDHNFDPNFDPCLRSEPYLPNMSMANNII